MQMILMFMFNVLLTSYLVKTLPKKTVSGLLWRSKFPLSSLHLGTRMLFLTFRIIKKAMCPDNQILYMF